MQQELKSIADRLIPAPDNFEALYKDDGNTGDIITQVLNSYANNKEQLSSLSPYLRTSNLKDTCRVIWQLVKHNIAYVIDPPGRQWIRTPARLWADKQGDCKSYSVFIASCLYNLGIKGCFRFVSFKEGPPTHVYVVVKHSGREIILDAVMPAFNQQKPFLKKWDYNMTRISQLSGIPKQQQISGGLSTTLNQGKRREVLNQALPGLAMLAIYQFIPPGRNDGWAKNLPNLIATPDDLLSSVPAVVKQKRQTSFDSFWDFGDWANIKVESEVFPKLKELLTAQLGMDPTQWWRNVLSGRPAGNMAGVGFVDPATIAATLKTVGDVFKGIKNTLGGLFGGSDIKWKRGDPSQWGADPSDWQGYAINPLIYIPTASPAGQAPLPVTYIPPTQPTVQLPYTPPPPQTSNQFQLYNPDGTPKIDLNDLPPLPERTDNTMLYVAGGALLLLLVMKK